MRVRLSAGQRFPIENNLVLLPIASNWSLMFMQNVSYPIFNFMKNSPLSGMFTYKLKPKSSFTSYTNNGYSNLKVKASVNYSTGANDWLMVECDWFPVSNYTAANQSTYKDLKFYFVPLLTTPPGNHQAVVKFQIEGIKNNITEVLSTYEITAKLNVFEDGFYYNPSALTFYNNATTNLSQELQLGGDNWTLNLPSGLKMTGSNVVVNPDGTYTASGTGYKNFNLSLNNNINDLIDDAESIILPVQVLYPNNSLTIPVTVIQSGTYYPTQINFQIQNGSLDDSFKIIHLTRSDEFTVQTPANIGYEILNTTGKKVKVFIVDPSAYGNGNFTELVSIIYPDTTYHVTLSITVGNQFNLGLDFDTVFTDSMDDLEFTTNNVDSFINLKLKVVGNDNSFTYQFPFFKGEAKKNIGKSLSNYIDYENSTYVVNTTLNSNLERIYALNYFNLNVVERKNNVDILSFNKTNVPFVKGFKPVVKNNVAILQHNVFSRYTAKSFALISVYSLTGVFDYKIMKNNVEVFSVIQAFGYIRILKLDFTLFNATAGDIFDFVLQPGVDEIKKSFVIFPETTESIDLVYIDSFGMHSCINFTGNTKNVTSQFLFKMENFNNKGFLNLRKHLEKETSTIVLNTGFLLKGQNLEVAELMKSSKVWIIIDDKKFIELVPKTEKIEEESNDDFLYSHAIEFELNKDKYAQGYNF